MQCVDNFGFFTSMTVSLFFLCINICYKVSALCGCGKKTSVKVLILIISLLGGLQGVQLGHPKLEMVQCKRVNVKNQNKLVIQKLFWFSILNFFQFKFQVLGF